MAADDTKPRHHESFSCVHDGPHTPGWSAVGKRQVIAGNDPGGASNPFRVRRLPLDVRERFNDLSVPHTDHINATHMPASPVIAPPDHRAVIDCQDLLHLEPRLR